MFYKETTPHASLARFSERKKEEDKQEEDGEGRRRKVGKKDRCLSVCLKGERTRPR